MTGSSAKTGKVQAKEKDQTGKKAGAGQSARGKWRKSESWSKVLLGFLPAAVFFSYHPVISLGSNNFMNFDLSLIELWLVAYAVSLLPRVKDIIKLFGWRKIAIFSAVPLYFTASIIWSENRIRTLLTAGILWLLLFAVLGTILLLKEGKQKLRTELLDFLLFSATVMSVFCWAQCIMDVAGVSREVTEMCQGCTYSMFGFPHPNGFAIEPQFMGNLLLAPALLGFYLIFSHVYKNQKQKRRLILLTLLISTTIFLTLSRGAIYAFILGLAVMLVLSCTKWFSVIANKLKTVGLTAGMVVLSAAIALLADGVFAQVSRTDDTFYSGVTKAVHQLTLGVVDLRPGETAEDVEDVETAESTEKTANIGNVEKDAEKEVNCVGAAETNCGKELAKKASFSGYVVESTNTRLNLSKAALETWAENPQYMVIGTGMGSAGIAINRKFVETIGPKEIVQNEYVSLLLETGILGCVIIILVAIYVFKKMPKNPLILATLLAFLFSILFFSGLPNALHIFLLPVLFATKDKLLIKDKV